jgi:hypothetical protein
MDPPTVARVPILQARAVAAHHVTSLEDMIPELHEPAPLEIFLPLLLRFQVYVVDGPYQGVSVRK